MAGLYKAAGWPGELLPRLAAPPRCQTQSLIRGDISDKLALLQNRGIVS